MAASKVAACLPPSLSNQSLTVFSIMLLIIVGLVILLWPGQTHLDRLKDAATFGGFALLLASFALTARRDHAMGDF